MKTKKLQKNIPDRWKKIRVDEIFDFLRTHAISRDNLINGTSNGSGIGNVHYGDIHATYRSSSINLNQISVPLVKDSTFSPNTEDLLKDGDLIMADVSEDYEGIGTTVSIHGIEDKKIVGGLHTFVLRDVKKKTDERYRQYIFQNPDIRKKLKKIANGVSVYGISKSNLSKLILHIPSLSEQKRIVSVLETWDEVIEKLGRKIEAKKKVKKGLMQGLLTGKVRLSGFTDEWKSLTLGSIGQIVTGNTPSKRVSEYYGNEFLWATALDFKGVYIKNTEIKLSDSGRAVSRVVPIGSVLVTCIASIGKNAIAKKPMSFNQQINAIIPNKKHNSEFIYYLIENSFHKLKEVSGGGALAMISKGVFEKIRLVFPGQKEQIAIANILTTADNEIEALQKKLSILKDQKKYLLNNLITGTIRTPKTLSINA
jgi:type I restriction enzyme S subunit